DRVERRFGGAAASAVAFKDANIGITKALHALARQLRKLVVAFDRHDLARQLAENRGRITGARSDLENLVTATHIRRIDSQRDDIGLADGLAGFDRQRTVGIGVIGIFWADELFPRDGLKGGK